MNSPNPAYYEALATARGVRPAPARSWSILLTSTNHGVVGPRGSTFPHAGEHHERVVVVEVPAGAGAPVDQVDLKLVSGAGAAAADAHPAPGHFAVTKLEEVISWVAQLPVPTRGACTMINKLREARYALLAAPVAAQAGQVAVPEGFVLVPAKITPEMKAAGGHANSEWLNDNAPIGEARYAMPMDGVWAAMLTAAPSPAKESK